MTCNTPKKDDTAAGKCCGRGCHGKADFQDASTPKPDAAPQTPVETPPPAPGGCCGSDKTGPDCAP